MFSYFRNQDYIYILEKVYLHHDDIRRRAEHERMMIDCGRACDADKFRADVKSSLAFLFTGWDMCWNVYGRAQRGRDITYRTAY